jgi:hypothetical protein
VIQSEIRAELPDQIAHGFLKAGHLHALDLGNVRCYQFDEFHTGFTLFSPDGQASVYVQMYQLPKGEKKLGEDLAFQVDGKKWGNAPKGDALQLKIFPACWTHDALWLNPKRIVHQYRGPNRAVFIRYVGQSLRDPLFIGFNEHLRYVPDMWHTELVNHVLAAPAETIMAPAATVDAVDLRVEQAAIRKMILEGVERFASHQREPDGDVHDLPVTGIVVWFDVGNGHASVHFDVRAPFENDGAYSHEEFAALPRENWRQFVERLYDGHPVTLTGLDGKAVEIASGSDFDVDEAFGRIVLDLVRSMRTQKAFAPLFLAPGAELIIEADDFAFAWPQYEDRGKDNGV